MRNKILARYVSLRRHNLGLINLLPGKVTGLDFREAFQNPEMKGVAIYFQPIRIYARPVNYKATRNTFSSGEIIHILSLAPGNHDCRKLQLDVKSSPHPRRGRLVIYEHGNNKVTQSIKGLYAWFHIKKCHV